MNTPVDTLTAADVIVRHPITMIVPNRYQRRHIEPNAPDIAELAENIRQHTLQNPVIGRMYKPGVIELVSGHRRHAAFTVLAQTDPAYKTIPVIVRDLTDRQMFEACAVENMHRRDLSAIEKAISLRDYIGEFHVGQAEAGKLFSVGQSGVSHLLSLLKLPEPVKAMVDLRELPERTARALVPLVAWQPDLVVKIAQDAQKGLAAELKAKPDSNAQIDTYVQQGIDGLLQNKGLSLKDERGGWPLAWPKKPLPVPGYEQTPGTPAEIPACDTCKFKLERGDRHFCMRPGCYAAKQKLWPIAVVMAASAQLGIPMASEGERVTVIWDGTKYDSNEGQRMEKAVRAKRPDLRLVPAVHPNGYDRLLNPVTSSVMVWLATTDKAALLAWLDGAKRKPVKGPIPKNETPEARALRVNGERELLDERAQERGQYRKAVADLCFLLDHAAQVIADQTVAGGGLALWAAYRADKHYNRTQISELGSRRIELEKAAVLGPDSHREDRAAPMSTPELDRARRAFIAYAALISEAAGYVPATKFFGEFAQAMAKIVRTAQFFFGVELPAGWDTLPIHRTNHNCWQCGAFAGNPGGLTKAELKDGWAAYYEHPDYENRLFSHAGAEQMKGAVLAGVLCPVHRDAGVTTLLRLSRERRGIAMLKTGAIVKLAADLHAQIHGQKPAQAKPAAAAAHDRGHKQATKKTPARPAGKKKPEYKRSASQLRLDAGTRAAAHYLKTGKALKKGKKR